MDYNQTNNCWTLLQIAFTNISGTLMSPFKDASGKVGSGILEGNLAWLGNYDQCESLQNGKYCLLDISTTLQPNLTSATHKQETALIRWGLCAVSSCNSSAIKENLPEILNETMGIDWLNVTDIDVNCATETQYSIGFFATVFLTLLLMLLCFAGTITERYVKHKRKNMGKLVHSTAPAEPHLLSDSGNTARNTSGDSINYDKDSTNSQGNNGGSMLDVAANRPSSLFKPGKISRFLICFSVPQNLMQLMNTQHTDKSILCLNGIRFFSIAWIVLGHTFLATFSTNILVNPKVAKEYTKKVSWQLVGNAYFAVDTFFFLSGLLVTYLALHEMQKRDGKFPLPYYYIHRYLRLTPSMTFSMLIWMFVKPYLGSGPLWYQMQSDPLCEHYWWTNLLYIQNFYPTEMEHQCIGWTWYLSLDMQFYMMAPIFFIALFKSTKAGLSLIGCALTAGFIVTAVLIGVYGVDVNLTLSVLNMDISAMTAFENIIYGKPYCRISTYLIGMVFGYVLFKVPKLSLHIKRIYVILGWMISTSVALALIFGMYCTFHGHPFSMAENIAYGALSHTGWGLVMGWITCACWFGYGGFANEVLSWKGFLPLSRLTYSIYLTHPIIDFIIFHSMKTPLYVSDTTIVILYTSVLLLSILASVILMLLVELPVLNMERCFSEKEKQK